MRVSISAALAAGLLLPFASAAPPPPPPPPGAGPGPASPRQAREGCRCLPGDDCWPSASEWQALNKTVDGRLVATVPLGSPCHDPNYDEDACQKLKDSWTLPQTHLTSSSSLMTGYFANQSCDPFTDASKPCELGNYVVYSVDVAEPKHVSAALKFAHDKNIRPVVRSTGHDFLGRSSGAGGLGIWLWNMKNTEIVDYHDEHYTGKALKAGPGVLGSEGVKAAAPHGLSIVSGECPTVALAGGYTQGGGHSALSTEYGLAADQTLEFEVVLPNGLPVKASRKEHSDLYWALSGGGGGNYGVVTSVTVRAHPTGDIGGASLQMASKYTTQEKWYEAVAEFYKLLPGMIDAGASIVHYVSADIFVIMPVTVVNSTGEHVKDEILAPFTKKLAELAIPSQVDYSTLSYYDHYDKYMGPLPWGHIEVSAYNFGSRLIPKSLLEDDLDSFVDAIKKLNAGGVLAVGSAAAYKAPWSVDNAVLPAWRDAYIQMQLTTPYSNKAADRAKMESAQRQMTNEFNPELASITPGSGAYMNEADFREPNWKKEWFGDNYEKLLAVKRKYDPDNLLYMFKGVGSDAWSVASDGRMCRT